MQASGAGAGAGTDVPSAPTAQLSWTSLWPVARDGFPDDDHPQLLCHGLGTK